MKRSALFAVAFGLSLAATASAGEFAGVKMPDAITAEGKTLKLNGMGLRKKVVFKVYVAGLYVESPSKDSAAIIAADEVKRMQLSVLRGLSTSQVAEAIEEGFEKGATKGQMAALKARLEKLRTMIPNVVEGDQIVFTYVPGKGTVVSAKGPDKGVIEGKDFADALFSVWIGPTPVQEDLKKHLLGG